MSKYLFLTKEILHKLKLKNCNIIIKIGKQHLIDIIDIKNTGLCDENGVTNMSYILWTKVLYKNIVQKNVFLIEINIFFYRILF